jgi:hypothetical protein
MSGRGVGNQSTTDKSAVLCPPTELVGVNALVGALIANIISSHQGTHEGCPYAFR